MAGPHSLVDGPMLPKPPNPRWRVVRRWLIRVGLLVVLALVLVLEHRPLLVGFARWFRVDDPVRSDALVLLLGGPHHRPRKAAELYRQGLAPIILLATSPEGPWIGLNETAETRKILIHQGVPPDAIRVLPGPVTSTREEALRVRDYVRAHPIRRITIVTVAFHTARARRIFRRTLRGLGVDVHMAASREPTVDESDWYKSDEGLVTYFSEAIKTIYYQLAY